MKFRRAFWLIGAIALSPGGLSPAEADSECPYLTRPLVEIENGITRINQWEHGTLLCYRGRMLRCEVGTWYDYGDCPQGLDWQARDALTQEQNAHPEGVTTPAPVPPAETLLPAPPTMSQPLSTLTPTTPAEPPPAPAAPAETSVPAAPATSQPLPETTSPSPAEPPPSPPIAPEPAAPVTTTALPSAPMIVTPPYDFTPEPESTAPEAPAEGTVDRTPIDCSDMERLTFERLYNKSFVESQQCQSACANDACKQECEYQHENVRAPKLMERFHSEACHATWYP